MRRLYIGGLNHSVTQKDLKDRFGKFGEVEDVEVRTRRDDDGVPYKTFSYININISDADFKKCMTVLNKSKWKGGILQIETAKQSFLHKLAEERQELAEQCLQPPVAEDKRQKMLDSLSKAGIENFTMKAAVPGTEVPGHKDWVVSKFGRVLPVLQLQNQKGSRARTLKYDPSKYSHNIRKLDRSDEHQPTPVTQLTWEVQGGDDDISKKRRGEFPPFDVPRPKKKRNNAVNSHNAVDRTRLNQTPHSVSQTESHHFTNGHEAKTNHRAAERRGTLFTASDMDSDEEICKMMAIQNNSGHALQQDVDEDNLEVVGLDYLEKSGQGRQQQKAAEGKDDYDSADTDELFASRKPLPSLQEGPTGNNTVRKQMTKKKIKVVEEEENSSEADEGLNSRRASSTQQRGNSGKQKQKKKIAVLPVVKPPSSESDIEDEDKEELESAGDSSDADYDTMFSNVMHLEISFADLKRLAEESQQTLETPSPSILSADLTQQSAPKKGTTPEEILAALMEDDSSEDERQKKRKKKKKVALSTSLPAFRGTRALDEGPGKIECQKRRKEEDEEEEKEGAESEGKKQRLNSETLDSKTLSGQKHTETESSKEEEVLKKMAAPQVIKVTQIKAKTGSSSSSDDEEEEEEKEGEEEEDNKAKLEKVIATPKTLKLAPPKSEVHAKKAETDSSSSEDDDDEEEEEEEEEEEKIMPKKTSKAPAKASPSSSSSSEEEDSEHKVIPAAKAAPSRALQSLHESSSSENKSGDEDDDEEEEEEKEVKQTPLRQALGVMEEEEKQRKANMRRLAAVQQRQKEAEEHKKLIQGALSNMDAPTPGAGKHIVFGSDDEDDEDDDADVNEIKKQTSSEVTQRKKILIDYSQSDEDTADEASVTMNNAKGGKVRQKTVPQLFGGSEDEEDANEEDGMRFDIRPQFEGEAGQKLMELQSRFGTDSRFRMDSRFLDEEKEEEETERKKSVMDEEELEEERKKNLSILQSVLGSSICCQETSSSKTSSKAKTFRDVSALHYDPSKEEHTVFETKQEETKESKSARKKKREEAEKLPEVSKEIYYDVSTNLKAVFGSTKEDFNEGEQKTSWDQEEEEEEEKKDKREGKSKEATTLSSSLSSVDPSTGKEESSGFKFSFFEDTAETGSGETAEYKVESLQVPKVSWQQDPRYHDSSSEEEDEEEEEQKKEGEKSTLAFKTTEEVALSSTDLFFFYPEDSRLTEGPRLFCRPSHLEEQREQWEETRMALRQEYRKKHKDARRKMKSSHKS